MLYWAVEGMAMVIVVVCLGTLGLMVVAEDWVRRFRERRAQKGTK